MTKRLMAVALGFGFLLIAPLGFAQSPAAAPAAPNVLKFNSSDNLQANLARHVGERVELMLNSGQTLIGIVKEVGVAVVHIGEIQGKEFFDALVRIDQITAVVMRVKNG